MGFSVPLAAWFRGPLRQRVSDALLGPLLNDSGLFNADYLQQLVSHHQSGRRDYSTPIWALLMFDAFLRKEAAA
jgi:asparagine synthase (glutamine-hydrolysing)